MCESTTTTTTTSETHTIHTVVLGYLNTYICVCVCLSLELYQVTHLEVSEGSGALRVHNALRDALAVEVRQVVDQGVVLPPGEPKKLVCLHCADSIATQSV